MSLYVRQAYQELRGYSMFSDTILYIILRCLWCDVIALNVNAPGEDKTYKKKGFYEELEQVFHQFPQNCMNILLRDVSDYKGQSVNRSQMEVKQLL
jgi:hypothetical protein